MTTIKDVAKLAKVAPSSVSRVLNKANYGSSELRKRVLNACEKLNYVPNVIARSMILKTTNLIGVIVPDAANSFNSAIIKGAYDFLSSVGYDIIIANNYDELDKEKNAVQSMLQRKVDGIISISPNLPPSDYNETIRKTPIVLVDTPLLPSFMSLPCVYLDHEDAGYTAGKYILKHGHSKIGVIATGTSQHTTQLRINGITKAFSEASGNSGYLQVKKCHFNIEHATAATIELLSENNNTLDAIISLSNTATLGVLMALKSLHLQVKTDIALLGFGDENWYKLLEPNITVIAHPRHSIGSSAAQMLLRQIHQQKLEDIVVFKSVLIERDSV
jgi:LacI family transcriptional regulator